MLPPSWHFQTGTRQLCDLHMFTVCYLGTAQGNNKDSSLWYNVETVSFHRREIGNQGG